MPAITFDLSGFALDVLSTTIGAVLGFVFALLLSWMQSRAQARSERKAKRERDTATLKHSVHICGANVESLLNFKTQYAILLAADAATLKPFMDAEDTKGALAAAPGLRTFYQSLSRVSLLQFPNDASFDFAIDDVPFLTLYVHRALSAAESINERADSRNALIAEMARANGRGMSEQEVVYFTTMLISEAFNILDLVDQALFFHQLVHDQIHNYGKHRFNDGDKEFRKFELVEGRQKFMPPRDLMKGYREQMVDFATKPKRNS